MVMTVALIIFCPVIVAVVGTTDGGGAACTLYASHHHTNVVVLPGKRAFIPGFTADFIYRRFPWAVMLFCFLKSFIYFAW